MKFRDLAAADIDVRVQSVKQNGLVLLLYKNARVDMNILDETVGAENWQREHYECKGNLYCRVGINVNAGLTTHVDEEDHVYVTPLWVWKSDCGAESNTEAEKGEASDSFKRACFNWGIGRELYTCPFIWISADKCNIKAYERNGKKTYACYDKFEVENIKIQNKQITGLTIVNATTGKRCFVCQKQEGQASAQRSQAAEKISPDQVAILKENAENERVKKALAYYKVNRIEDLTRHQADQIFMKLGL